MKKIYNLLALVMLFTIAGGAQARYWESMGNDPVTTPEAGVAYFISLGTTGDMTANAYLAKDGTITTTFASAENNVWYFEADGEQWKIYCLDAENNKHYLAAPTEAGKGFVTTTASRIGSFGVYEAVYAETAEEAEEAGYEYYTTATESPEYQVLLVSEDRYLQCTGVNAKPGYGTNRNANIWWLIEAQEMGGLNYLDAVLAELWPDGFDPDTYETGINPGQYKAEALEALVAAYDEASSASSDEEAATATDALLKAWKDFQDSFISFQAGYYIFTNYRDPVGGALYDNTDNIDGDTGSTYAGRTVNGLKWCYSSSHSDNANHSFIYNGELEGDEWYDQAGLGYMVWQVIATPTPNRYYFRNWKTGNYIHVIDTNNKQVPVVKTPTDVDLYTMEPNHNYPGFWTFFNDNNWVCQGEVSGIHASGDYANTVAWKKSADASCWAIRTVTEEDLAIILEREHQPMLNMQLASLVNEVKDAVKASQVWSLYYTENGEIASDLNVFESLEVDGLVTSEDQLYTNSAHENDGSGLAGLVDGDCGSYYHSGWNDNFAPKDTRIVVDPETGEETEEEYYVPHFIQMDLNDAYQKLTFKWFTRGNGSVAGRLTTPAIYVSTTGGEEAEEWTKVCDTEFHYTAFDAAHKVTVDGEVQNCWVGVASVDLGGKYQYVRIEHLNPAHNEARPYMNGSELRVYEGLLYEYKYDTKNSTYESVPADLKESLNKILATAEDELEDALATEETIAALQAAFDKFKAALPDPAAVNTLVAEARAQADSAEEGEEIGYFETGAADALNAALDAIHVDGTSTPAECEAAKAAIKAAVDAFNAKLHKPANGTYYYVRCATEGGKNWLASLEDPTEEQMDQSVRYYADDDFLGTRNANGFNVAWGAESFETDIEDYAGYVWQSVTNADGTFSLKHCLTGLFLSAKKENNSNVVLAPAGEESKFTYQSAKVAGVLNIVFGEKVFLNFQPGTNNVVTWNAASGNDNSAIYFEEAEAPKAGSDYVIDLNSKEGFRVMTLPTTVTVPAKGTLAYEVLGYKDGNIELKSLAGKTIAAGTPFVFDPDGYAEAAFEAVQFDCVTEAKTANGLVGVLEDFALQTDGNLVVRNNKAVLADVTEVVGAGFGFFANTLPETTATGDAQIACPDGKPTSINNAIVNAQIIKKGTFDLQGRRVSNAVKGIYIINGEKVLVK